MFCPNCGNPVGNGHSFCGSCGNRLQHAKALQNNPAQQNRTVQMRCRSCDGTMTLNAGGKVLMGPYCGSAELMIESDEVVKERIRGQVTTQGYQVYRDIETSRHSAVAVVEGKKADAQKQKFKAIEKNGDNIFGLALVGLCFFMVIVLISLL